MNKLFIGAVEIPIKTSIFPGGESYVKIEGEEDNRFRMFRIESKITTSNDIMELLMLTDAVRRKFGSDVDIDLVMPYIPYARQDRVCREGESLSIKVFCDLINSQKYSSVEVWDAHSDVALALLDNVHHVQQEEFVVNIDLPDDVIIVQPDQGAEKKIPCQAGIVANKFRDGSDVHINIVYNISSGSEDLLVIDDICDGGRTFIELAKKLKELTTGDLYLYTTHGIYSKGLRPLLKYYKHIYTANPFAESVNRDYLTIVTR